MFKQQKFYIIDEKMDDAKMGATKQLIERNGGELAKNQHSADILLTSLKSPPRIKRHLKTRQIPVVDIRWLKDCVKEKKQLPLDSYYLLTNETSSSTTTRSEQQPSNDDYYIPKPTAILTKEFKASEPDTLPLDNDDVNDTSDDDNDDTGDIDPTYNNTKYECLRSTPLNPKHNNKLVAYLRLLEKSRQLDMHSINSLAYRHAIAALKSYPREIRSAKEAGNIIGIGAKIKTTIKTYLETGTVPEAEALLADERFRTLKLFNKCFGVGPSTAIAWWDMGYRSLQQVLDGCSLTPSVRLGIQLLPDFIQSLKLCDVEELIGIIENQIAQMDDRLLVTPVGGYRRGKQTSGDLDIIVSSKQQMDMSDILPMLLDRLKKQGYIKHVLWKSLKGARPLGKLQQEQTDDDNNDFQIINKSSRRSGFDDLAKAFTCFMQPSTGIGRQVDFIIATVDEYPTALLGWTGSRQFERSIKEYAKKEKNLKIKSNEIITRSIPERRINVTSEMDIFKVLGIPFVAPQNRNC
ncbi:hypothetical protein BC941DRAFT_418726 [Chlamydoabsidia padenii]|nr:hypothetical protein BC941DRAFT_418726 [Chlamydoabsidia padenii]